jgi:hypothetical protein
MRQHSEATSKRVGDLEIYAGSDLKTVQGSKGHLHICILVYSCFSALEQLSMGSYPLALKVEVELT